MELPDGSETVAAVPLLPKFEVMPRGVIVTAHLPSEE